MKGIEQKWIWLAAVILGISTVCMGADPVVSNVRANQRSGTKLVDIFYDVSDADSSSLTVSVQILLDMVHAW